MESVNKRVVLIAIIMALFTSFLVYTYIKKATSEPLVVEHMSVYVAAKTMSPKYKITEADLKEVKITREYLNPKAVINKADIVGKRLRDSIIEGEQILSDRLVDESNLALSFNVPEGKRAVSINVDEQTEVANLIIPGDAVDVIASFEKEEIEDKANKTIYPRVSKVIIQNVKVLALGQDQIITDEKPNELPKTVTLAVSPQEAEKLVYASEYGILRLALRHVDDDKIIGTDGSIRSDIVSERGVKVLPK